MIQDGIIGELSLTKPFIGCYLGSEFSELNRPLLDNESRNLLTFTKTTKTRDRQRKSTTKVVSTVTANSLKPREDSVT